MGWKTLKEALKINHTVMRTQQGICIGSPYIHNILVINNDGMLVKDDGWSVNAEIDRYQREIRADPARIKALIQAEDKFERSLLVYTYKDAEVIEKFCEEYDYPNVTHDGEMMYDNTFFRTKEEAAREAISQMESRIACAKRMIGDLKKKIQEHKICFGEAKEGLQKLNAEYPQSKNA